MNSVLYHYCADIAANSPMTAALKHSR